MNAETHDPMRRIQHILSEQPFFEEFEEDELACFANYLSLRTFDGQAVLFQEGDMGDHLCLIVSGEVEVRLRGADRSQIIIAKFGPGCSVGEMSIIDDAPRSATVVATGLSELLLLSRKRFEAICEENPRAGLKFLRGLARNLSTRLRKANGRFADIA